MKALKTALVALFVGSLMTLAPVKNVQVPVHSLNRIALVSTAVADEVPAPVPAEPSFGEKLGKIFSDIAGKIPMEGMVITALVFLYDFARRKWPTKNPASLIRDVHAIIGGLMSLLGKIDQFLDKVFGGQNLMK